jgi:hypothetical protein
VVVAVELSRLLRRALFVAALGVAGWLLSVAFSSAASADELPPQDETLAQPLNQPLNQRTPSDGLLGGLIGGLSDTLGGVTDKVGGTWVDTSGDAAAPEPSPTPILDLPSILPSGPGSGSGGAAADKHDIAPPVIADIVAPPAPASVVPAPPPPPPPPVVRVAHPTPAPPPAVPAPAVPPAAQESGVSDEQAGKGDPEPQPVKTPSAPASTGTTVSASHDSSGGARGTHGVLAPHDTLHPADAGFTTRSRAVNAAGRVPGLPASSPD